MVSDLSLLFDRDLAALKREVRLFPDDATLWTMVPGHPNAAGTLVLHLCGNLRHFIGGTLGGSGYVRDREVEFSRRDATREELVAMIETTRLEVAQALQDIGPDVLPKPFPLLIGKGVQTTTQRFLLHLLAHLAYHVGQLDYARRGITADPSSADVMAVSALSNQS